MDLKCKITFSTLNYLKDTRLFPLVWKTWFSSLDCILWRLRFGLTLTLSLTPSQVVPCRWRGEGWKLTCPSAPSAGSVPTAVATPSSHTTSHSITVWQSCGLKWRCSGVCVCVCVTLLFSFDMFSGNYPTMKTWTGRRCCAKWRSWGGRWSPGWTRRGDTWCRKSRSWRTRWRSSRWTGKRESHCKLVL